LPKPAAATRTCSGGTCSDLLRRSAPGPRLGLIVNRTDAEREWATDRDSPVGRLDKALDDAPKAGWVVVDMKKEWKTIYPFEK
jgi:hypothetical protein